MAKMRRVRFHDLRHTFASLLRLMIYRLYEDPIATTIDTRHIMQAGAASYTTSVDALTP